MSWLRLHFEYLETYLLYFCNELHGTEPDYSSAVLRDICGRYNRDLPRMKKDGPDPYKHAATAIFWIKKHRPIYVRDGQSQFLNEAFAYYFGIGPVLHGKLEGAPIPKEYRPLIKEMIYALRYRNITPQNMDFVLKAMYPKIVGDNSG